MNDKPTTKKIDSYQWREYTIFDTPGINAPEKDEEVSKEQLEKCDVILFVTRSDGAFELGKNYNELADIVRSGKHLLIVVNSHEDESGDKQISPVSPFWNSIKKQIHKSLAAALGRDDYDSFAEKYPIYVVNAKDALLARTSQEMSKENKEVLLKHSHIEDLEYAIVEEYKRTNGLTILRQLATKLKGHLGSLRDYLQSLNSNKTTQHGNRNIDEIYSLVDELVEKIADRARSRGREIQNEIFSLVTGAKGSSEEDLKKNLQDLSNKYASEVTEFAKRELGSMASRVNGVLNEFGEFASSELGNIEMPKLSYDPKGDLPEQPDINIKPGVASDDSIRKIGAGAAAFGTALTALAPVIAIPVAGQVIGVAVAICGAIAALFGGSSGKEKGPDIDALEEMRQAQIEAAQEQARIRQEARDFCNRLAKSMIDDIITQIRGIVETAFEPCVEKIREVSQQADKEAADAQNALARVREIETTLDRNLQAWQN